jgi:hypothetical protein
MPRSTLTDNQFGFNPDSLRFVVGEGWLSRRPFCVEQTLPCASFSAEVRIDLLWRSSSGVPQLQWGEMKPTVIRLWSWKNGPVLVEAGAAKKSACRVHSPQSLISSIGNLASKKAQSRPNNQE